ncbi:MAG: hypothetical protein A2508_04685 [Candidatus Lambdaproteobacteria bacterium RIFOXYD12_FULL_49_8]|uniref:Uncharacterized protein n=1 Tax=Candidatus Lambdaproteobacteria bacterium RIFOXYD2_FULL_50_16 TaxID=1817772 RepID=A0A1F6GBT1_9PROT|nr:MAG: hypothetical protein A2527_06915 [Candidatus Lambdaproteobacteria bacterium RIFOXYD2_FULL_50_16]OGG97585.1 MAG: hypothetical protein A2508_04685 [Candidatus Lambdaproteobacteria bacterium RIFOXYD12_FULL_49_8]
MSWEKTYLRLRLEKQIAPHDTQIEVNQFVQGLTEIYGGLLEAAKARETGARAKLADFAVEYLNVARNVYQGGPSYKTIKDRVVKELGEVTAS